MLYIIGLIITGLIIGALGRLVHPGADPMPIWLTIIIGIGASLISGLIFHSHHIIGFIVAVIIAAVLVAVVGNKYGRGRTSTA
jgi:uncharacterized membrane protein YeaQ/YmgE (transglycosylase-associated protein family)